MNEPLSRVAPYFEGDAFALAVKALRSYYSRSGDSKQRCFTGSAFDEFAVDSKAKRYTAQDILAVTMLSVRVPPRTALWLLDQKNLVPSPEVVPPKVSIWDTPDLLRPHGRCWGWSGALRLRRGVGRTIASKLMAVKRPGLVPIYDKHVDEALDIGQSEWAFWRAVAEHEGAADLRSRVAEARAEAGVPEGITDLRAIDVVVWMRQYGWTTHAGDGCPHCDYTGFGN